MSLLLADFQANIYLLKAPTETLEKGVKLRIWSHLLNKSLIENFIFGALSDYRLVF